MVQIFVLVKGVGSLKMLSTNVAKVSDVEMGFNMLFHMIFGIANFFTQSANENIIFFSDVLLYFSVQQFYNNINESFSSVVSTHVRSKGIC